MNLIQSFSEQQGRFFLFNNKKCEKKINFIKKNRTPFKNGNKLIRVGAK